MICLIVMLTLVVVKGTVCTHDAHRQKPNKDGVNESDEEVVPTDDGPQRIGPHQKFELEESGKWFGSLGGKGQAYPKCRDVKDSMANGGKALFIPASVENCWSRCHGGCGEHSLQHYEWELELELDKEKEETKMTGCMALGTRYVCKIKWGRHGNHLVSLPGRKAGERLGEPLAVIEEADKSEEEDQAPAKLGTNTAPSSAGGKAKAAGGKNAAPSEDDHAAKYVLMAAAGAGTLVVILIVGVFIRSTLALRNAA